MITNRTAAPTTGLCVPHPDGQSIPFEASTIRAGGAANRAVHCRNDPLDLSLIPSF